MPNIFHPDISKQLKELAQQDQQISWNGLVAEGLQATKEKVRKAKPFKLETFHTTINRNAVKAVLLAILCIACGVAGHLLTPDALSLIKAAFGAFLVAGGFLMLAGLFVGTVNEDAWRKEVTANRIANQERIEGLILPEPVTYEARVQQTEGAPYVCITRSAPTSLNLDNNAFTSIGQDQTPIPMVSENAGDAVEELDAIMLALKELQEQSYARQLEVLTAQNIETPEKQAEYFATLQEQSDPRFSPIDEGVIARLNEHARHHHIVNQEMFVKNSALDDIEEQTRQLNKISAATQEAA